MEFSLRTVFFPRPYSFMNGIKNFSRFGGRDHRVQYTGSGGGGGGGSHRQNGISYSSASNQWNQPPRAARAPPQQVSFYRCYMHVP